MDCNDYHACDVPVQRLLARGEYRQALKRQEAANGEVIAAVSEMSRDVQAPPDFVARVLAKADQQSVRRPPCVAWLGRLPWGVDVAVAALLILALVGAVPQYLTWFNAYIRVSPPSRECLSSR